MKRRFKYKDNTIEESIESLKVLEETDNPYAESTISSTKYAISLYEEWRKSRNIEHVPLLPLDATYVSTFIKETAESGMSMNSIETVILWGLVRHSKEHLRVNPMKIDEFNISIKKVMKILKKRFGSDTQKTIPLVTGLLYKMVDACSETIQDKRLKAILLINSVLGCRCSSLSSMLMEHIDFGAKKKAVQILIVKDKNPNMPSRTRFIDGLTGDLAKYCPVTALIEYLTAINVLAYNDDIPHILPEFKNKPVWISLGNTVHIRDFVSVSPKGISKAITRMAERLGFKKSKLSGHSMRRGFVTQFAIKKLSEKTATTENILEQICLWGGWERGSKVVREYVDDVVVLSTNMSMQIHGKENENTFNFNYEDHAQFQPTSKPKDYYKNLIRGICDTQEYRDQLANAKTKREKRALVMKKSQQVRAEALKLYKQLEVKDLSGKSAGIQPLDEAIKNHSKKLSEFLIKVGLEGDAKIPGQKILTKKQSKELKKLRKNLSNRKKSWKIQYINNLK